MIFTVPNAFAAQTALTETQSAFTYIMPNGETFTFVAKVEALPHSETHNPFRYIITVDIEDGAGNNVQTITHYGTCYIQVNKTRDEMLAMQLPTKESMVDVTFDNVPALLLSHLSKGNQNHYAPYRWQAGSGQFELIEEIIGISRMAIDKDNKRLRGMDYPAPNVSAYMAYGWINGELVLTDKVVFESHPIQLSRMPGPIDNTGGEQAPTEVRIYTLKYDVLKEVFSGWLNEKDGQKAMERLKTSPMWQEWLSPEKY